MNKNKKKKKGEPLASRKSAEVLTLTGEDHRMGLQILQSLSPAIQGGDAELHHSRSLHMLFPLLEMLFPTWQTPTHP